MQCRFAGGNNNWNDSYYFAFPFNVSTDGLKVIRGGQNGFDKLPDDYLPGARKDSVSTQHLFGLTDGRATAMARTPAGLSLGLSRLRRDESKTQGSTGGFSGDVHGQVPAARSDYLFAGRSFGKQADTHDVGIINIASTEPGLKGNMVFEYAFAGGGTFDPVRAWRMGADFNLPLRPRFTAVAPAIAQQGFFSVDQPNVQIVTVKTLTENVIRGEVSSAPLNPTAEQGFRDPPAGICGPRRQC